MIMEIWEGRYPAPIERDDLNDFVRTVNKPVWAKAGYKNLRFGWMSIGGPMNVGILIAEIDSLADLERAWTLPEMKKFAQDFHERFPGAVVMRRVIEVVE